MQSLSPIIKDICAILSIADIFHESDGAQLLSTFPAEHQLCQVEYITEAKTNRRSFVQSITSLARVLRNHSNVARSNEKSIIEEFESIETACSNLITVATNYKESLSRQRIFILGRHGIISDLFIVSSSKEKESQEWMIKYNLLYRALSSQLKRQMDWEAAIVLDVMHVLQDGSIYSHYNVHDSDINRLESFKHESSSSEKPCLAHLLKKWASGIEGHLLLDEGLWLETKDFLQRITERFSYEIDDHSSVMSTINGEDYTIGATGSLAVSGRNFQAIEFSGKAHIGLKNKIQSCSTIQEAIHVFMDHYSELQLHHHCITTSTVGCQSDLVVKGDRVENALFLLLIGPVGSGKTHIFDSIQHDTISYVSASNDLKEIEKDSAAGFIKDVIVIRPRLPVDFLGENVGSFEDTLLSLFTNENCNMTQRRKYIILLDNIEHIIGETHTNEATKVTHNNEEHVLSRTRSIFLTIVDRIKYISNNVEFIVICSAEVVDDGISKRFDKIFRLEEIHSVASRRIIEQHLNLNNIRLVPELNELMTGAVESTIGRSKGEIAYFCREALNQIPFIKGEDNETMVCKKRLLLIKENQGVMPDSIRHASHDGFVEMAALSANDLRNNILLNQNGIEVVPLLGKNAQESWNQMANIIIAPLCNSGTLDTLLYGGNKGSLQIFSRNQSITSGVLLTGKPGSGKTAIAYHCAAVAAGIDSSIKLLDVSCTSLVHKEVGGSEIAIKRLFDAARTASPCILLLDGIENIAPVRGNDNTSEGTMDRILSTLLTEMDGIGPEAKTSSECKRIAIIGITHNIFWIDPALRRPGRLEKCVHLEQPDSNARKAMVLKEISGLTIDFSLSSIFDKEQLAEALALSTAEKSAAEVIAVCKEARLLAMRENIKRLQESDGGKKSQSKTSALRVQHFIHVVPCLKIEQ